MRKIGQAWCLGNIRQSFSKSVLQVVQGLYASYATSSWLLFWILALIRNSVKRPSIGSHDSTKVGFLVALCVYFGVLG